MKQVKKVNIVPDEDEIESTSTSCNYSMFYLGRSELS